MKLYLQNAVAAIIKYKDKYLFQLRDKKKNIFFPEHWGLFGGAIDKNETKINALIREVKEELSITLKKSQLEYVTTITFEHKKIKISRYFYFLEINDIQKKKIKLNEGKNYGFFEQQKIFYKKIAPYDSFAFWLFINSKNLKL